MPFLKTANFGNPHIGLFARASERLAIADISSSPKFLSALEKLEVPLITATFGGSGLAGIFSVMNSNGIVVPPTCSQNEILALRKAGFSVISISSQFSAAGNNIAANDFGAVANPELPAREIKRVSDCLGVEVVRRPIAGYLTSGSCVLATNKGFAAHNRASEEELKELESILRVPGSNCTLNTGLAFVPLGAIANSKAALFGEASTGFEVGRVAAALGMA